MIVCYFIYFHTCFLAKLLKALNDDEPLSDECTDPLGNCYLNHAKTFDLDATFYMVYQWRRVVDAVHYLLFCFIQFRY